MIENLQMDFLVLHYFIKENLKNTFNLCLKIDLDKILLFKFIYFNTKIGFRTAENISMALRNFL